jgi:preprotein translocase subunit SecA
MTKRLTRGFEQLEEWMRWRLVSEIDGAGRELKNKTDRELEDRVNSLREVDVSSYRPGTQVENRTLVESFSLVREASRRVLGLYHYRVQILGGIALSQGNLAEMKTGEGKTLVALLPVFLYALFGKGAHVVTVNDYLARRDAAGVGQVYRFLGLSVGLVQDGTDKEERVTSYQSDVTYITSAQLGFDYLRDNMAHDKHDIVQRGLFYCLVDEADSVLIDEAGLPLVISGRSLGVQDGFLRRLRAAYHVSMSLRKGVHYRVYPDRNEVLLTKKGVLFCGRSLGLDEGSGWFRCVVNALKAKELFIEGEHYVTGTDAEGVPEVTIVDTSTGRLLPGRRWERGLHQAIEAKESIPIRGENKTMASISYQELFSLYERLSGMTGTAEGEREEFQRVYGMNVVRIPENVACRRVDLPDVLCTSEYNKWASILKYSEETHKTGQPVLIGTTSVEKSELLSELFKLGGTPHRLLNARVGNVQEESEIVAQAGRLGRVTIATNMAGRGTDILLGGDPSVSVSSLTHYLLRSSLEGSRKPFVSHSAKLSLKGTLSSGLGIDTLRVIAGCADLSPALEVELGSFGGMGSRHWVVESFRKEIFRREKAVSRLEREKVVELGGLVVVGTECHESRRIDDQLRGRAGRQGDPGLSVFFVCSSDRIFVLAGTLGYVLKTRQGITAAEEAQKRVEGLHRSAREQFLRRAKVIGSQRECLYRSRKLIMEGNRPQFSLAEYVEIESSLREVMSYLGADPKDKEAVELLGTALRKYLRVPFSSFLPGEEVASSMAHQLVVSHELDRIEFDSLEGEGSFQEVERAVVLRQLDAIWARHLGEAGKLHDFSNWRLRRSSGALIPDIEESHRRFIDSLRVLRHRILRCLFFNPLLFL